MMLAIILLIRVVLPTPFLPIIACRLVDGLEPTSTSNFSSIPPTLSVSRLLNLKLKGVNSLPPSRTF